MAPKMMSMGQPTAQRGAVLVVTLIALALVTLVTFSASRSSTVNMRIAVAQEVKTATFQAAESGIVTLQTSTEYLGAPEDSAAGRTNFNSGATDAPIPEFRIRGRDTVGVADDVKVTTVGATRFRREAAAIGNSIRKGGAGFQTFHYDVAVVAQSDGAIGTQTGLTQGVYVEAPRVN